MVGKALKHGVIGLGIPRQVPVFMLLWQLPIVLKIIVLFYILVVLKTFGEDVIVIRCGIYYAKISLSLCFIGKKMLIISRQRKY